MRFSVGAARGCARLPRGARTVQRGGEKHLRRLGPQNEGESVHALGRAFTLQPREAHHRRHHRASGGHVRDRHLPHDDDATNTAVNMPLPRRMCQNVASPTPAPNSILERFRIWGQSRNALKFGRHFIHCIRRLLPKIQPGLSPFWMGFAGANFEPHRQNRQNCTKRDRQGGRLRNLVSPP